MRWLSAALLLAYPLLVYAGLARLDARLIWILLGALALARLFLARERLARLRGGLTLPLALLGAGLLAVGVFSNDARTLFLVPAGINLALLASFGASLWKGPPLVETFARLQTDVLSEPEVRYCRAVTRLWCGFFLLNAAAIVALALWGTPGEWAAYTGLVSYLLVGVLFAGEYVWRHYRFRRYIGAPTDALLKRFFPPRPEVEGTQSAQPAASSGQVR